RVEQVEIAHIGAIAGLLPPDRDHDRAGDAGAAAEFAKLREVGGVAGAAAVDQSLAELARAIGREGREAGAGRAAGLAAIELDGPRGESQVREDPVESLAPDPRALGLGAQGRQPGLEALLAQPAALSLRRRLAQSEGADARN